MTGRITELYLVRHARAAERGPDWPDDDVRPITPDGARRFAEVVRALGSLGVQVDVVVTSPLTRARQTADLLADGLSPSPSVRMSALLSPDAPPGRCLSLLSRLPPRVAFVGHEPDLGRLTALLVGTVRPWTFKKGGVCRIDVRRTRSGPLGHLVWFAPPSLLRRVAPPG